MSRRWLVVFALLLAAVPASADPEAEAVRDKVRAAVGYDAFRKMEHGVVLEGKTQDLVGDAAQFRWRFHADGRYARVTESKVAIDEGFDGKLRWDRVLTNPASPIELMNGGMRRLWNAIPAHYWLAPTSGYSADNDPTESRPYRPCILVRHRDYPGVAARVYVDPQTWLPTHYAVTVGKSVTVIELSDYREVGGAKFAGRVAVDRYGGAGDELVVAGARIAPAPQEGENPFAAPPPSPDTRFAAGSPVVEAKATKSFLLVRPVVNGKQTAWFAVQTAMSVSHIAAGEADRLGLAMLARRPAPKIEAAQLRVRPTDRFTLGPASIDGLRLYEAPDDGMAALSRIAGVEVRGLLGNDVLSRMVMEASWSGGTVAVYDPVNYRPQTGLNWQPIRSDAEWPCLEATFEGRHTGLFGLASGDDSLTFGPVAARSLRLLAGRDVEMERVTAVEGDPMASRGVGAEFRVFGRPLRSVRTRFWNEDDGGERYPYVLGTFGPSVLGPGTLVFDYPHSRIGFVAAP
jgi:hypothetical protein